jgi:predicted ATPase/DNA-binding winged helix-turn-helix (wHTH) protein
MSMRWTFADAVVDEARYELRVGGRRVEIDRKPLEVLVCLLRSGGAVVRKDRLAQECWPRRVLSDAVLDKTLSRVREALAGAGDGVVETVRGVGWRIAVPVSCDSSTEAAALQVPNNLPASVTSLVGRDRALDGAHALLVRPGVRLLTLTGCGGIGKTRLAVALAASAAAEFPDGIYFVDLAPLRTPELFIAALAQPLQVREAGHQALSLSLQDHLRRRRVLLVLDNFEQIVDAAPQLSELLAACAGLKAIVTSRERLNVRGEHELEVTTLGVPPAGAPLDALRDFSAVVLFEQRARMVKPDFAVDADVAEICRRLDGLPLALELAAARSKLFAPAELLAQLGRRFDVLRDGPRDLPARHQTLWATVDWSYELLETNERRVLRHVAVFAGGFTLAAAQSVCAGGEVVAGDVFALVARLVDKSLVQYEDQGNPGRYRLLETIREYALARLTEAGERDGASQRHLEYLLGLAREAAAHVWFFMSDPHMAAWLPRMTLEHDNLRVALDWGAAQPRAAVTALELAAALHWYWFSAGHISDPVARLRLLLERAPDAPSDIRAQAMVAAANLAVEQGGSDAVRQEVLGYARAALDASLPVFRARGEASWTAYTLSSLASFIVVAGGDPAEAQQHVEEGLALARSANDRWLIAFLTHFLGRAAWFRQDLDAAAAGFTESIAASRAMGGNQVGEGYGTYWLGRIARARGDLAAARTCFLDALRLFHAASHLQGVAYALTGLGGVAAQGGDAQEAVTLLGAVSHWREALRVYLEADLAAEHGQDLATASARVDEASRRALLADAAKLTDAQIVARASA